jgi:hypothetical protein
MIEYAKKYRPKIIRNHEVLLIGQSHVVGSIDKVDNYQLNNKAAVAYFIK